MAPLKILHLDAGRSLLGGPRQVIDLIERLSAGGMTHVLACATDSELPAEAQRHNIATRLLDLGITCDFNPNVVRQLRRLIRAEKPDILHLHCRRIDALTTIAGRLERIPMVFSHRNFTRLLGPEKLKLRQFDRIVTISAASRKQLVSGGLDGDRIDVVTDGVDTQRFAPRRDARWFREEFGLPDGVQTIAMVAAFRSEKNHRQLVDALSALHAARPQLRTMFFGDGPLRRSIEARVQFLGLGERTIFAGYRHDMDRIMPNIDVVVHPARAEGMGVALLEAAACSVPIVATPVGGIPEVVRDGVNGYCVGVGDSAALAEAAGKLLGNASLRSAFGEAGRKHIVTSFSAERMAEGNLRTYERVMEQCARSDAPRFRHAG